MDKLPQCRYRIKDALSNSWFVCQREEGHRGGPPPNLGHQPPPQPVGKPAYQFEGPWHLPPEPCKHERLTEDGQCRDCGFDCRGIH